MKAAVTILLGDNQNLIKQVENQYYNSATIYLTSDKIEEDSLKK